MMSSLLIKTQSLSLTPMLILKVWLILTTCSPHPTQLQTTQIYVAKIGEEYDLAKDGEFGDFVILIGCFYVQESVYVYII